MISFSTKARTLEGLKDVLKSARIAPLKYFTVVQWREDQDRCLNELRNLVGSPPWIVRSSCLREDSLASSNAGAFLSISNVNEDNISFAINQVIESYTNPTSYDEVLIQQQLDNVLRSGVSFSHDPNSSTPYRVINWSEGSNTRAITGGESGRVWQQAEESALRPPTVLAPIILLTDELLNLFDGQPIDCEFAITKRGASEILWLLQVRPLILPEAPESNTRQKLRLELVETAIKQGMKTQPFLLGKRTAYGVMPDWNPAEMIGIRPKPLALSLYEELITDSIWAYQRHNYGYRNLRSFPLMVNFFGLPYIDVRVSFNSFIPADLDDGLAGRLVDHYLACLINEPAMHDKVEFQIVLSCYSFDMQNRFSELKDSGFSNSDCNEIKRSLRNLTNRLLSSNANIWRIDAGKILELESRRNKLFASNLNSVGLFYWLIEDLKRYGTLPFAGLARVGFIAVQILQSLQTAEILSPDQIEAFMASINSVSKKMVADQLILDKSSFLATYGHLRPGTYDILSPRYDKSPDLYFNWVDQPKKPSAENSFRLTKSQENKIDKLLVANNLRSDASKLFDFIRSGIELRELAKFNFSRNLSDALEIIAEIGEKLSFSREEMAFCEISELQRLFVGVVDPKRILEENILKGKSRYSDTLKVTLPPLIISSDQVWGFEWPKTEPNYVTQRNVVGPIRVAELGESIKGAIVCIQSADPGFDWIFSHSIIGLITAWGGINSHMAIRAGEMGIPAVIGVGEIQFQSLKLAKRVSLDCANRTIKIIS
jgi:phosphohistidine swiveling domain-containing protein